MISILHILPSLDPEAGGVSQAVRSIIGYSVDNEVEHEVLCLDRSDVFFLQSHNFKIHALGKGLTRWNYSSKLKRWLSLHLRKYNRVIVHGLWQYQSYSIYRAWKLLGDKNVKLYVVPHGMLDPYFQKAGGRGFKAIRNIFFWEIVERRLINEADAVLFTCDEEELLARATFRGYKPKRTAVAALGIEQPPAFSGHSPEILRDFLLDGKNRRYFLFLGRIHSKKGIDLLIRSYLELKLVHDCLPALVIAGPGLDTDFGKQMIKLSNMCPDILFSGMLSGQCKWDAFYGCEAFVLPSHQENFGIAVVEALACGKPVLISNQINIYREIESDGAGMVGPDTFPGTFGVLKKWLGLTEQEKEQYTQSARLCYENRYAEAVAAKAMLDIIK
jgi:glycosyltransferase involved in cell wall biosynthesis